MPPTGSRAGKAAQSKRADEEPEEPRSSRARTEPARKTEPGKASKPESSRAEHARGKGERSAGKAESPARKAEPPARKAEPSPTESTGRRARPAAVATQPAAPPAEKHAAAAGKPTATPGAPPQAAAGPSSQAAPAAARSTAHAAPAAAPTASKPQPGAPPAPSAAHPAASTRHAGASATHPAASATHPAASAAHPAASAAHPAASAAHPTASAAHPSASAAHPAAPAAHPAASAAHPAAVPVARPSHAARPAAAPPSPLTRPSPVLSPAAPPQPSVLTRPPSVLSPVAPPPLVRPAPVQVPRPAPAGARPAPTSPNPILRPAATAPGPVVRPAGTGRLSPVGPPPLVRPGATTRAVPTGQIVAAAVAAAALPPLPPVEYVAHGPVFTLPAGWAEPPDLSLPAGQFDLWAGADPVLEPLLPTGPIVYEALPPPPTDLQGGPAPAPSDDLPRVTVTRPDFGVLFGAPKNGQNTLLLTDFWGTPDARGPATTPAELAVLFKELIEAREPAPSKGGEKKRKSQKTDRPSGNPPIEIPILEAEDNPLMRRIFKRLTRQFGLQGFRPGQERAIRDIVAGRDVLALMPTGAGKSLIYQLPAFELDGVTVVVSPLLALMRDQEQKLRKTGVVAARLDSTLTTKETAQTLDDIEEGRRKIIYVTPERAASGKLEEELGGQKVSLFVVDEAHCVSEWGHDFRPSYLSLQRACEQLGRPVMCALTATATPKVADDIIAQLGLRNPDIVHHGFDRPSLGFEVRQTSDEKAQVKRLLRLIRKIHGSVIVYCSTIRTVEALAKALPVLGLKVGMYHGKLGKAEREDAQQGFMKGNPRIMVATNAFGLGVDKPDIRAVIHYNLPGTLEAYYQEAGRAGRDGRSSRCVLLYNPQDEHVQEYFVAGKYPTRGDVWAVWQALNRGADNLRELALAASVSQSKTRVVLGIFKDLELAAEQTGQKFVPTGKDTDELTLGRAAESYRRRREGDRDRLAAMIRYAQSTRCRIQLLLEYFGEKTPPLCRRCDNCLNYGEDAVNERAPELAPPREIPDDDDIPSTLPRSRPMSEIIEPPKVAPPPRKNSLFF